MTAILLLAAAATAQAQVEHDGFSVGGWDGAAFFDAKTDRFIGCGISGDDRSAIDPVFRWSHDGLSLIVVNYDWALGAEGTEHPVTISVDDRWSRMATGRVIGLGMLQFQFAHDQDAISALRLGDGIWLDGISIGGFGFHLAGTNAALQALEACYERHGRHAGRAFVATNPFGSPGPRLEGQGPDDRSRLAPRLTFVEFAAFVRTNISAEAHAGLSAGDESKAGDYYFIGPGTVVGFYLEASLDGRSAGEQVATWLATAQPSCDGRAASSLDQGAGGPVASAYLLCARGGEIEHRGLVLANRADRMQMLTLWADGDDGTLVTSLTQAAMDGLIATPPGIKPRPRN